MAKNREKRAEELAMRERLHQFDQTIYQCERDLKRTFGGLDIRFSTVDLRQFFSLFAG
jgi:hypothetical protein